MATVLLYHARATSGTAHRADQRSLFIDAERLGWQLSTLHDRGFRTLTLDEFNAAVARPGLAAARELLLTFDDAYAHVLDEVAPMLRRSGMTAVAFAPVAYIGAHNSWDRDDEHLAALAVASAGALREAENGPWEVASHGFEHVDLTTLEPADRRIQLATARDELSEILGREVRDLAYPYGCHDAAVRADARATGYRSGFTAAGGKGGDSFQIPRRAVRAGEGEKAFLIKASGAFAGVFEGV
jgi:peptidoglycan/xylan/chitin deacetylase (PgdA/CDA1 family)